MKQDLNKPIIKIYGQGRPILVVVGCLHGDELVGKRIINILAKLKIKKGTLITVVANPKALSKKKRFIDQDLNRSFPGKKMSKKLEERIAFEIMQTIKSADYVIDIHSTSTDTQDVVIIKRRTKNIKKLLNIFKPSRVLLMPRSIGQRGFVNHCHGISFEYGAHNSPDTFNKTLRDIKRIMVNLDMLSGKKIKIKKYMNYYTVYEAEKKPKDFKMNKDVNNFKLFKRGGVLGKVKNKKILAKENFYPVLFGAKAYEDIMGFKAKKVNKL